jgi:hypothetical protein
MPGDSNPERAMLVRFLETMGNSKLPVREYKSIKIIVI